MAMLNEMTDALVYQLSQALAKFKITYTGGADDITDSLVYAIPDFNIEDVDSLKKLIGTANYGLVVSGVELTPTDNHPTQHLRQELTATIYVIRKTVQDWDVSNKRSLILYGGKDGKGNDITSMSRIANDIAKWFASYAYGSKLKDSLNNETAFFSTVESIGELKAVETYYYMEVGFRALGMESIEFSAT